MSGELFEFKMSALLFLRSINSRTEFHIATNMDAAGSFDDVVLTIGGRTHFLQAKHKQTAKVYKSQLIQLKGNFSLLKYYKSYIDLKHRWSEDEDLKFFGEFEKSVFVIYTNATLAEGIGSDYGKMAELDLITTGGKCTSLLHDRDILQVLEILPKYKELLSQGISCEHLINTSANLEVIQKLHNNNATTILGREELIKLLKELEQIGDVSHFRQFLSQFFICSEQTGDKGLDSLIRFELKNLCGSDIMFEKFMSDLQHWWRNPESSVYLTHELGFWKDIMDSYTASVTQRKIVSLSHVMVKYNETDCREMRTQLGSNGGMFVLISSCRELTCVKVLQSLQTDFVVDYSTLQTHTKEVLAVWKLGTSGDVLVVDGWEDHDFVRKGICDILTMFPNKKLVVITTNNIFCEGLEVVHLKDDFDWYGLNEESQEIIKNIPVRLQGYNETVGSVASTDFLFNFLTGTMLLELISAEHGIEIGHELDSPDASYISRRICRRMLLSLGIFHERQVILAVSGISLLELTHLVPAGEFVEEFITGDACPQDCRYFIISTDEHYQALCEKFDQVHWIHMISSECCTWKGSKQNMKLIKSHLLDTDVCLNSTETMLSNPDQVVLIVSEPGMGKSTELLHFTKMFKTSDPTTWVVRVNLNEHIDYFEQTNTDIIELLVSAGNFDTELQRCLFDNVLHTGNVVLMFDGFDEISPLYSEKVIGVLKELMKTKVKHIFITSRPVMKEILEEELCTLSYSLGNFTVEDQEEFLLKFWKIPNDRQVVMKRFIEELLVMTCSFLNDLTRNPLQMRMLAEIYIDDADQYYTNGKTNLADNMDLLQLYNKFIEKKWDIFYNKFKINKQLLQITFDMSDLKRSFLQNHMVAALSALFSTQQIMSFSNGEDLIEENIDFLHKLKRGIEKKGIIVNEKNGNAVFVHRTFAEYFVALWFTKNVKEYTASLYTDPNLQGVRNFFDRMFSVGCSLHFAVLNRNSSFVKELLLQQNTDVNKKDKGGRTALHLAVACFIDGQENTLNHFDTVYDFEYECDYEDDLLQPVVSIIKNLLKHNADPNIADNLLKWTPLRLADEIKAWCAMGYLLKNGAQSSDIVAMHDYIKEYTDMDTVPSVVFTYNFVELLDCMLKCGMVVSYRVRKEGDFFITLLYCAVRRRSVKMVEVLLQHGTDLEEKCCPGETPLLLASRKGASNMVKYLLGKGADFTTCDDSGTTVLHYAAQTEDVDMVSDFLDKGLSVNCRNKKLCTPLMFAARAGRLEVMKLLHERGADLHARNEDEYTILDFANLGKKHDTVEWLLEKGCNLSGCSLHIASLTGDLSLAQKLLEVGCEVDRCNNMGYTPLHVAAISGHQEVIQWLLQVGANAKACDAEGNSLLHFAAFGGNEALVEWLVTQTEDIDTHNKNGYTPLHVAILASHSQVVKCLIEAGASLAPDLAGNTLLHLAAHGNKFRYGGRLEIMKRLVRCGVSLTSVNTKGWTVLHIAAYRGGVEMVKWIVKEQKMDLEIRTQSGYTPYELAALSGHQVAVKWLEKQKACSALNSLEDTSTCVGSLHEDCAKTHLSCGISPIGINFYDIEPIES